MKKRVKSSLGVHGEGVVKNLIMKLSVPARTRKGFTLVELLVVIMIIGVLVSITLPVVYRMAGSAEKTACANNLKDLYGAATLYQHEHYGRLPANGMSDLDDTPYNESLGWFVSLAPYLYGKDQVGAKIRLDGKFRCPADEKLGILSKDKTKFVEASKDVLSYVPWTDGSDDPDDEQSPINVSRGKQYGEIIWLSDGLAEELPPNKNITTRAAFEKVVVPAATRHDGAINVVFANGAIKPIESPNADSLSHKFAK